MAKRATKFTRQIADRVIAGLKQGMPLTVICREEGMPCDDTVRNWADADEAFGRDIAHARAVGFDALAAECLEIADTPVEGVETVEKADGAIETRTGDMLGHRKLQIETRLKLLAKWDPKRYGERTQTELTGAGGGPITVDAVVRFIKPGDAQPG